ncbi:hypothetical protein BKA63DRAFT_608408 [Paraphoma chrysanthemicola]|nr:hypothetical protein BKA63DRAFT_608408 [Paraphoma chrysanthemicola]
MPEDVQCLDFPSWSWAASIAFRPPQNPRRLRFGFHNGIEFQSASGAVKVRLHHRTGLSMSLIDYLNHEDDYLKFYPFIDVTSMTMPVSIRYKTSGKPQLSIIPQGLTHLHQRPTESNRSLLIAYVGMAETLSGLETIFIVVEEVTDQRHGTRFRQIGICSHRISRYVPSMNTDDSPEDMRRRLSELTQGLAWRGETLGLV